MKKIALLLIGGLLLSDSFLYATEYPIVKSKLRGGRKNDDESISYRTVTQEIGQEHGKTGWIVRCVGSGPNACPVQVSPGNIILPNGSDPGIDMIDLTNAETLQNYAQMSISNGTNNGSYNLAVMDPNGMIRTYTAVWIALSGDPDYDHEIIITKNIIVPPIVP